MRSTWQLRWHTGCDPESLAEFVCRPRNRYPALAAARFPLRDRVLPGFLTPERKMEKRGLKSLRIDHDDGHRIYWHVAIDGGEAIIVKYVEMGK